MLQNQRALDLVIAKALLARRAELGIERDAEIQLASYLRRVLESLKGRVMRSDFSNMSKGELRSIMVEFRANEMKARPEFAAALLALLIGFGVREVALQRALWTWAGKAKPNPLIVLAPEEADSAWVKSATLTTITGDGLVVGDLMHGFFGGVVAGVSKTLRAGMATNQPSGEIVAALSKTGSTSGRLGAFISTALVAAAAAAFVRFAGRAAPRYIWVSVLDSGTTDICRSLDAKTFEVGKGPKPPMHVRCRSTTAPYTAQDTPAKVGLISKWLLNQGQRERLAMVAASALTFDQYQRELIRYAEKNIDESRI